MSVFDMYMLNPTSQKALLLTKENFQDFEKFLNYNCYCY